MWCLTVCFLFLLVLFFSGLDALTKTGNFLYSGFEGVSHIPPFASTNAPSEIVCALRCEQLVACKSFSFRTGTEGCSLFPRRIMALDVDLSVPSEDSHFSRVLASCPAWMGYVTVPGTTKCIRVGNVTKTWAQAAEVCAEDGGHLLIIENDDVMQKLYDFLPRGLYHVGFTDEEVEGQHLWLDRTPVNRAMFYPTEPNDPEHSLSEDCGLLHAEGPKPSLHDAFCGQTCKFLCSLSTEE